MGYFEKSQKKTFGCVTWWRRAEVEMNEEKNV